MYMASLGGFGDTLTRRATWDEVNEMRKPGGEVCVTLIRTCNGGPPSLGVQCSTMLYTPQKHWPKELAESYFGSKTTFGTLRDPYERLVAIFRVQMQDYGGNYSQFTQSCDVNGAVKQMMHETLAGNIYRDGCVFLPQAEYFDEPHRITLLVDNRIFPHSMNNVFADHGYSIMQVHESDLFHVKKCNEVWSCDLDCETRSMVRQYYARDFDVLCKHFGYCNEDENTCIKSVPQMCPERVLVANDMSALETHC